MLDSRHLRLDVAQSVRCLEKSAAASTSRRRHGRDHVGYQARHDIHIVARGEGAAEARYDQTLRGHDNDVLPEGAAGHEGIARNALREAGALSFALPPIGPAAR